ncbi:hypothetical protein B9Z36_01830 [Limnohabitans sp. Rim8]|uniref:Phosphoglycerate mutase n=1 Tax=Limnohabitans curvus TaxID=323423 RepID=A0A315ESM7_9BURK|nr:MULTISPECIES: hypothetical protein [Limnohabitans]PUE58902.1 hypothetical protein B9Z44_04415 [Limnohabitans curvus]PUE62074.1 hypothetical protein B9Z36_01830 [Limnohabitans sp. Rim8]
MTSVLIDSVRDTTLIPFSLWTTQGPEVSVLAKAELPHLRAWLAQTKRVDVHVDRVQEPLLATLSLPHERAWAQAIGWPSMDGCLPWAARAAAEVGLVATHAKTDAAHEAQESHASWVSTASPSGWAFITLCNWHVSNGQVTLGDPAYLQIDEATDSTLFQAMQSFFAEDGIALHPYKPGQWLAHSPLLADLPTASVDRVIGRNIDPWLVGSHTSAELLSPAAKLLRRLQNEMQMLLYTHSVNDGRGLTINSFWVHGTGVLPLSKQTRPEPAVVHTLRQSALQQDLIGWLEAWQHVDAHVIAPMLARVAAGEPQRLVLCGEYEFHVYDSAKPSLWQRLRTQLAPTSLDTVLAVAPLKD